MSPASASNQEASGAKARFESLGLNSSLGLLVQTSGAPILGDRRSRYDAKIGVSREFGKIQLSADVNFAGPDGEYYDGPFSGRSALRLSASRSF